MAGSPTMAARSRVRRRVIGMRICFTSDLHGRENLYAQLVELVSHERPDLLLLGGDLLPDGSERDPAGAQAVFMRERFVPALEAMLARVAGLRVACVLGNHECVSVEPLFREAEARGQLVLLEPNRPWRKNGTSFLGFSLTPPTPHWLKDYERLDMPGDPLPKFQGVAWDAARGRSAPVELAKYYTPEHSLESALARATKPEGPWIFVCHAPPHGTRLDQLPGVDYPIGSRAVRAFVERARPFFSLHGHVRESPLKSGSIVDRVGEVACVNPGQDNERLHAVLFDSERPLATLRHTALQPSRT
jgi:Icc-related predicted phosphoesterase